MKRRRHASPQIRYVYVIGPAHGLQKIGMAVNPQARLATLQTASPHELMIHAAIAVPFAAAMTVEQQAHGLLGLTRIRNEWFEATPAEALFAVYTAAMPWLSRTQHSLPPAVLAGTGPREPRGHLSAVPPGTLPADLLPLFRERAAFERGCG